MSRLWINGTLVDKADARVSPFDHGFLYGDGVWEHLRVFGGQPFRLREVFDLLVTAAIRTQIEFPHSPDELGAIVSATAAANGRADAYVRVVVSRGPGTIGPDPRKIEPQVLVIAEEYQPFPAELYGHGLHAASAPSRVDPAARLAGVRVLGRPEVVEAKRHALDRGCLEAVILDRDGSVFGCTEGNLFLVTGGEVTAVRTWPRDPVGTAVREAVGGARELAERPVLGLDAVLAADEVFLAGTACGVIGIVRLDGRDVGPGTEGPVTRRVRDEYHARTRGGS